tara:strand:- start:352 stop:633 length:282 start_codon:yes stop_codon:yes gene_type:complete
MDQNSLDKFKALFARLRTELDYVEELAVEKCEYLSGVDSAYTSAEFKADIEAIEATIDTLEFCRCTNRHSYWTKSFVCMDCERTVREGDRGES